MSDRPLPTLDDLAWEAGRKRDASPSDIDQLEAQCLAFLEGLPENHGATMARSKLSEMLHWIKASRAARLV